MDIELVIPSRERDLGGFTVHRVLPYAIHRMVGPFIFFDHMGPAIFAAGQGVDVRPHPHINLATVTYLFEGQIRHRDSLGSDQLIEPGDINWMTAGHGIVHSERTPDNLRKTGSRLSGIQCWVALPESSEEIAPSFKHYAAERMPQFQMDGVQLKLLLGSAFDRESPVEVSSDLFYLHVKMPKGSSFSFPLKAREGAVYVAEGKVLVNELEIPKNSMAVGRQCGSLTINALEDSQLMLLGGMALGKRYIYWNFVSSSEEKIAKAKADWANGPGEPGSRFPKIPLDDQEFIPLPEESAAEGNPKGAIM
ncbi:MAG: pirin family protein [Gammaproteobacteria bacterium]